MKKYSGLSRDGKIIDFTSKDHQEAIKRAKEERFKALLHVKNYTQNGIISTLLEWKEEGYSKGNIE